MHLDSTRLRLTAVALAALTAMLLALWQLGTGREGLAITTDQVGDIPVTVWRTVDQAPAPVVVIAHGFAGSQPLMQPFATTLARNGYIAVSFDFPGHGRHPRPLSGGLADPEALHRDLLGSMAAVSRYAQALPGARGLAVLGHSMAADIVVRHAQADPAVRATIAVSLFFPEPEKVDPPNLLIIDGALEAAMLRDQGAQIVSQAGGAPAVAHVTYGRFDDGSARRLALATGVEHIGVLYSRDSQREALEWLDQVFDRAGDGYLDVRGPWLGLLFLGWIGLALPLSRWLPQLSELPPLKGTPRVHWWAVAWVPALLTPLLLWKLPTEFLPLLLGDYLALHFALYGGLTALGVAYLTRGANVRVIEPRARWLYAAIAVAAYSLLGIGLSLDTYVTTFVPGVERLSLVLALFAGTLPYFVADEWLTRRFAVRRGAYAATKAAFLLSLIIAVALNLEKLFFLVIIVPAILLLFGVYGLFSAWVFRRTGHPVVAAVANALVFAWFVAVTFPVVDR